MRGPVSFFAVCFAPGQGYRWFVSNDLEPAVTVELRVGGVVQAVLDLAPFEGREVTTPAGGLGELVLDGEVVASATSSNVVCDSTIGLFSICSDAASGTLWSVSNDGGAPVDVRLVLDGVDVATVTLGPAERAHPHHRGRAGRWRRTRADNWWPAPRGLPNRA